MNYVDLKTDFGSAVSSSVLASKFPWKVSIWGPEEGGFASQSGDLLLWLWKHVLPGLNLW